MAAGKQNGVTTQICHAGTCGDPRVRIYVDTEIDNATVASKPPLIIRVSLAHGLAPEDDGAVAV